MMRALVTGASGMLGRHLVQALLAADVEVRTFVRSTSDIRSLKALPAEIFVGEAGKAESLHRAADGVQWVFHAAAHLSAQSPFTSGGARPYVSANFDFTESLLAASLDLHVSRFVYVSSMSVYGPAAESPIPEDAPLRPVSDYGVSKLQAEERVRVYQSRGLPATILRPCVIYGPGDRHLLPTLLGLGRLPVWPLIDGGRNVIDVVFARDVADLMVRAAKSDLAVGRVYNAGPGRRHTLREFVDTFRAVSGCRPRVIAVSRSSALRWAAVVRPLVARLAPGVEAALTPEGLAYLGGRRIWIWRAPARS